MKKGQHEIFIVTELSQVSHFTDYFLRIAKGLLGNRNTKITTGYKLTTVFETVMWIWIHIVGGLLDQDPVDKKT